MALRFPFLTVDHLWSVDPSSLGPAVFTTPHDKQANSRGPTHLKHGEKGVSYGKRCLAAYLLGTPGSRHHLLDHMLQWSSR